MAIRFIHHVQSLYQRERMGLGEDKQVKKRLCSYFAFIRSTRERSC